MELNDSQLAEIGVRLTQISGDCEKLIETIEDVTYEVRNIMLKADDISDLLASAVKPVPLGPASSSPEPR